MVNRSLLIIFNAVLAAAFLSAAGLLMTSVELKRNVDRNGRGVRIGWTNLMCKTPSPNLKVTEKELADYWTLPRTTRLSASMIETGRCAIAVNKRNQNYEEKWNHELCYCINDWWIPMMTIAALTCGFYACLDLVTGLVLKNAEEETIWGRHQLIRHLMICISLGAFTFGRKDQFVYTGYGEIFPSLYFDRLPTIWGIALWLFCTAGILQSFCGYGLALCVKSKRCNQEKITKKVKGAAKMVTLEYNYPKKNQGNAPSGGYKFFVQNEIIPTTTDQTTIPPVKFPCGCVDAITFVQHNRDDHEPIYNILSREPSPVVPPIDDPDLRSAMVSLELSSYDETDPPMFQCVKRELEVEDGNVKTKSEEEAKEV